MVQLQCYASGNNYTVQEVYNSITMAKTMIHERSPKFRNGYSQVVYDDGIWKLTLDISGVDNYRFWISREDRVVVNKYMNIIKFIDKKGIYE